MHVRINVHNTDKLGLMIVVRLAYYVLQRLVGGTFLNDDQLSEVSRFDKLQPCRP